MLGLWCAESMRLHASSDERGQGRLRHGGVVVGGYDLPTLDAAKALACSIWRSTLSLLPVTPLSVSLDFRA
jgi:hypothetical protein